MTIAGRVGLTSMGVDITLSRWSDALVEEIFRDREGEGRPVSTIDAGGALLARALARAGVDVAEDAALAMFTSAFPARPQMVRWFSGVDSPGASLPAFLILCCIAASEAAGSEANDYRERLREMMGWDAIIMDCAALPTLWRRLESSCAAAPPDRRLRPLVLPDPRHRTQIGHAIELTFPSRQDGRRLKRDLEQGGLADPNHPVAVMRWLGGRVDRYSPTFRETFTDFQIAWRSGARALTDHRFWSGWRMVVETWRPTDVPEAFRVVSDEWGKYQLIAMDGEPTTLSRVEAASPPGLRHLLTNGSPVLLREIDWGQWTWVGRGRSAGREAQAALIREKTHSASLLAQLDRAVVSEAPGWAFTTAVDLVAGTAVRDAVSDDDLIDVRFAGVPRIDGGRLSRPSFPIRLLTTGPVESVTLSGAVAEQLELQRSGPREWLITPTVPVEGHAQVSVKATCGDIVRSLSLRRSALAPVLGKELPDRFLIDEEASGFAPTRAEAVATRFEDHESAATACPQQGLLDLVEYLAARPWVMPLSGLLELVDTLPKADAAGKWSILRALLEAGVIEPLRVRGWRGGAAIARSARAVLVPQQDVCRLRLDGVINEVLASRVQGIADRLGLGVSIGPGVGDWSLPLLSVEGDREALLALAAEVGVTCEYISPDLAGHVRPRDAVPNADGSTHGARQLVRMADTRLADRGIQLSLCRREAEDAPPVWLVQASEGEPRYWTHRHLALLDACGLAGVAPFDIRDGLLTANVPGVFLPLPVARWLRLATGVPPGPFDGGYAYKTTPCVEAMIREFMGMDRPDSSRFQRPRPAGRGRGPGMAFASGSSVEVLPIWRWARVNRGASR